MKRDKTSPGPVRRFFSKLFRRKAPLVYACAALLCVVSFFLPGVVLELRDRTLARSSDTVSVDEVQLSLISDLSPAQRLALVGDSSATTVPLTSGRILTEENAAELAESVARSMSLLDKSASSFGLTLTPQLRVAPDDSSLLTWTAVFSSDSRDITMIFDDENGWCLAYRQVSYPRGKDALSSVGVSGAQSESSDVSGAQSESSDGMPGVSGVVVDSNGKYIDAFNDPKSMSGYLTLISRVLDPLGLGYDQVSAQSPGSVAAIIPYDNTYYSMPVSIHFTEHDGLTYALEISVNMVP